MRVDLGVYATGHALRDEKYDKMKAVFLACREAGIAIPDSVCIYFNGVEPKDEETMEVDLGDAVLHSHEMSSEGKASEKVSIYVNEIPEGVQIIELSINAKVYS